MLCSMTGYGQASLTDEQTTYMLEIRSVNNRYFKATVKVPEVLSCHEPEILMLLRQRMHRGSVVYLMKLRDVSPKAAYEINDAALVSYVQAAQACAELATVGNWSLDMGVLMQLPGVCQPPEPDPEERQRQWRIIQQLTDQALEGLLAMRLQEGQALQEDILRQCDQIQRSLQQVVQRSPMVLTDYAQRLHDRVTKLLTEAQLELDKDSLAREVAIYAERSDINEELARLNCHLDQFRQIVANEDHCGRKLEFLAQEMLREANTIGAKANDSLIAQQVVEIKGSIDRIKEQIQNVE